MNILLVSTIRHNPGDDFIRWGQQHLLRNLAPESNFVVVHKHDPRTLFKDYSHGQRSPHRLLAPILYRLHAARTRAPNLLTEADMVVFAGTPFIWRQNTRLLPSTSANAEWVRPIWLRLIRELHETPVINLGAGTSLNPNQKTDAILGDSRLVDFLNQAVLRTALTTARDRLTAAILRSIGHDVPVLPCTSLWAAVGAGLEAHLPEYVAINVMRHAVHPARGKHTASDTWKKTIRTVVDWISARHPVRLVCHSAEERSVARAWFPQHEAFYSDNAEEVLDAYGRAMYTVSNRVHGAAGAASFGRPALGIGGDSRTELLREFGLPRLDALNATAESIIAECELIETDYDVLAERLRHLSSSQASRYLELLRSSTSRETRLRY